MALDPSISLQAGANIPQLDVLGSLSKAQALLSAQQAQKASEASQKATEAATQTTLAQLPGVQADVTQKVRDEAARKFVADNSDKVSRINAKDGKREYDYMGMSNLLASAGFGDYAQSFGAKALANTTAELAQKATTVRTGNEVGDQMVKINELSKNTVAFTANLTRNEKDPVKVRALIDDHRAKAIANAKALGDKTIDPQTGQPMGNAVAQLAANEFDTAFGAPATTVPRAPVGTAPGAIAAAQAITPQTEIANKVAQTQLAQTGEQIAQAGAAAGTSPADRDPNSKSSIAARQSAIAAGVDPSLVGNLSKSELQANGYIAGIVTNAPVAAPIRVAAAESAATLTGSKNIINQALGVIDTKGLTKLKTKAGSYTESQWNNLVLQTPEFAQINAGVLAYNNANPGAEISIARDGLEAVRARLKGFNNQLETQIKQKTQTATSPTVQTPSGKITTYITQNGYIYNIPESAKAAFLAKHPDAKLGVK